MFEADFRRIAVLLRERVPARAPTRETLDAIADALLAANAHVLHEEGSWDAQGTPFWKCSCGKWAASPSACHRDFAAIQDEFVRGHIAPMLAKGLLAARPDAEAHAATLRKFACHEPGCGATGTFSRLHWRTGDEKLCNCGLAAALASGTEGVKP